MLMCAIISVSCMTEVRFSGTLTGRELIIFRTEEGITYEEKKKIIDYRVTRCYGFRNNADDVLRQRQERL